MITSFGPGEFADGLGLRIGDAVVVGLSVDDADGGVDGLVAPGAILEVGEESEPTGLARPHAEMTMAQTAILIARLAVIPSIVR